MSARNLIEVTAHHGLGFDRTGLGAAMSPVPIHLSAVLMHRSRVGDLGLVGADHDIDQKANPTAQLRTFS